MDWLLGWLGDTWWLLTTDKTGHSELTISLLIRIAIIATPLTLLVLFGVSIHERYISRRKSGLPK